MSSTGKEAVRIGPGWIGAAFGALLGLPASAQGVGQDLRVVHSCSWDLVRLCGGTLPGEGRIRACMRQNMSQLSAGCVDAMLTAGAAGRETAATRPIPIPDNPQPMTCNALRGVIHCGTWLFRHTPQGDDRIVQDELQNTCHACKEGACNLQP